MAKQRTTSGTTSTEAAGVPGAAGGRPMRADARRNYDLLVGGARAVFAREGGSASMEAIAKEAGVGVGTLYRHFPKRIDIVEAVYREDVEALCLAAEKAVANLEPWDALVAFMEAFVRYAQGKRTFVNELREAFEKNPDLRSDMREQIDAAMDVVVTKAQHAGVIRLGVSGADVMALIGPMCTASTVSRAQSERLVTMVLDGLRAGAPQS